MEIRIAHSPDSDDAFMFYALAAGKLPTGEFRFTHQLEDIETLNRKALQGEYEVTALSIHAYAYVADLYALLPSGASMGDRYGPMVVSHEAWKPQDVRGREIAVPGTMTTAFLALKLFQPEFHPVVMPFDQIMGAVERREIDAGLLIHEGQLTYMHAGLHKVLDLGEWWHDRTGLPLPLGGNGIRRDLGPERIREISRLIRESIQYALDHRQEALEHALGYARGLNAQDADQFVSMYVNSRTLDYGEDGRQAVRLLLEEAYRNGLIPKSIKVDFAD
ncbi:MAG: MqnA/MqnD/SBP family protein [Acidobacteriota bacterium]